MRPRCSRLVRTLACWLFPLVLVGGCVAPLDGGWTGRAVCEEDNRVERVDAILDEQPEAKLEGIFYIHWTYMILLAEFHTNLRGAVKSGEIDPGTGAITGLIEIDTSDDTIPDFDFELSYVADSGFEKLEGDLHVLDEKGDRTSLCELDLERFAH